MLILLKTSKLIISVLCLLFVQSAIYSQQSKFELSRIPQADDAPYFDVAFRNLASADPALSQMIFELTLVNDELQFIRVKKSFRADYEASLVILDSSEVEVDRAKKAGFLLAQDFDETNSVDINNSIFLALETKPGSHKFRIELKDVETGRTGRREGSVTLGDFSNENLMLSDIFLIDSLVVDATALKSPTDLDEKSSSKSLFAMFEIYNALESDSISIIFQVLGKDSKVAQEQDYSVKSNGRITRQYIQLEQMALFGPENSIKLIVNNGKQSLENVQKLDLSGADSGVAYANIDEAIEQLVYIAKDEELKKLKSLEEPEKTEAFEEFWKSRDPDPTTRMNVYKDEYYNRVRFANKRFTENKSRPGWKTEMGMVFIKLGPPDYVDTSYNRYNRNMRNEMTNFRRDRIIIWSYYGLRKRVIFEYRITEYRIANYQEVFDVLNDEMVF